MATTREQRLARAIENLSARGFERFMQSIAPMGAELSETDRERIRQRLFKFAQENYYATTNAVVNN